MKVSTLTQDRLRPGERLKQHFWLRALSNGGSLPTPTVDRIRTIKALVSTWAEEPDE